MNKYSNNYIPRFKKQKNIPIKETIGQCSLCLDIFSIFFNDLEGIFPSNTTYFEKGSEKREIFSIWEKKNGLINMEKWWEKEKNGILIHKCGGKIFLWKM